MGNDYFRFKQFEVRQANSAMRVNTDGVLLGAWSFLFIGDTSPVLRMLDVGTGTGVMALMLAQRFPQGRIDAVEIDEASCQDAALNFANSPWSNRLTLYNQDFNTFQPYSGATYHCIISNPPFFVNSLQSDNVAKMQVRHCSLLSHHSLLVHSASLLNPLGLLAIIIPATAEKEVLSEAVSAGFTVYRRCVVYGKEGGRPLRVMLELCLQRKGGVSYNVQDLFFGDLGNFPQQSEIVLTTADGKRNPLYAELTTDFYL